MARTRSGTARLTFALGAAVAILIALVPSAIAATPAADYRFQNTLTTSEGTAPALEHAGAPGNTFENETVNGVSRMVLRFLEGGGVLLRGASSVIPGDNYTIAALIRFDQESGYQRIADFRDGADDTGWYSHNGFLSFFPGVEGADKLLPSNRWAQVVLTRDAASKVVTGYVDGVQQFDFTDSSDLAIVDPEFDVLRFFIDDAAVSGEVSSGSIARLRLYPAPLTATEVSQLEDNQPLPGTTTEEPPVVEANVTIKYNGEYFNGYVRPQGEDGNPPPRPPRQIRQPSPAPTETATPAPSPSPTQTVDHSDLCDDGRRIVVKKERPGRDEVVGKDRSNYRGYWRVTEPDAAGVYYTVAKKKVVELDTGTVICARARSQGLRPPRQ
ncbi:MAG TPA: LamG-like jellyroll fold domain-containing protein [Actinomycetota bacterium]|nr:LamG-like jellyroll fold domain-containing protein [Actinomycetota bacterium]